MRECVDDINLHAGNPTSYSENVEICAGSPTEKATSPESAASEHSCDLANKDEEVDQHNIGSAGKPPTEDQSVTLSAPAITSTSTSSRKRRHEPTGKDVGGWAKRLRSREPAQPPHHMGWEVAGISNLELPQNGPALFSIHWAETEASDAEVTDPRVLALIRQVAIESFGQQTWKGWLSQSSSRQRRFQE